MLKKKKIPSRKKIALEFLHQRLGHRSSRSLLVGDIANVWGDIELRIDPDSFCTSCQISSMNEKARSKIPLKPKAPFKWFCMDMIPSTAPKSLTSDTTFSNYYFQLLMPTTKFHKCMVWGRSQQKKSWTSYLCYNPDLGKLTILDGGI